MTSEADDIRAGFVECLARAAYDRRRATIAPCWEDHDRSMEGVRAHHRQAVAYQVDALAAAGWLPNRIESRELEDGHVGQTVDATPWQPIPAPATEGDAQ